MAAILSVRFFQLNLDSEWWGVIRGMALAVMAILLPF
jgi:hypothetical protein